MEENQFARELNKFRVVRRPDHVGAIHRKRTAPVPASTSVKAPSKAKLAATGTATSSSASKAPVGAPANATFWDLLMLYAKERMPEADATKLVQNCEQLFRAEVATAGEQ